MRLAQTCACKECEEADKPLAIYRHLSCVDTGGHEEHDEVGECEGAVDR